MDFSSYSIETLKQLLNFDPFWFYGFLVFYVLIPSIVLLLCFLINFFFNYSDYREWKKNMYSNDFKE